MFWSLYVDFKRIFGTPRNLFIDPVSPSPGLMLVFVGKVRKIGKSLGVTIPHQTVKVYKIEAGDSIEVEIHRRWPHGRSNNERATREAPDQE